MFCLKHTVSLLCHNEKSFNWLSAFLQGYHDIGRYCTNVQALPSSIKNLSQSYITEAHPMVLAKIVALCTS